MQNLNETRSATPIHFPFVRGHGISFATSRLCGLALNVCFPDALNPTNTFESGIRHSTLKIRHLLRFSPRTHGDLDSAPLIRLPELSN